MGVASLAIICSLAAVTLATAAPHDPLQGYIDRSIFRDQRLFNSDISDSFNSDFFPGSAGPFFGGSNILATPQVLRSSVAAQVPLLSLAPCPRGLVRNAAGRCVKPVVFKNVFLFKAPFVHAPKVPVPKIPKPKVLYNYVYVNSADSVKGPKPIVIPPPQEKTLVYVLNKRPDPIKQEVIEVPPHGDTEPEVYFINYNEGHNQQLPGGVDLHTVLSQSAGQQALLGGSDLSLFAESSAAAAFGGQVPHIGGLSGGGSDFDFSDAVFDDDAVSSLGAIGGLGDFNLHSSARSFSVPTLDSSAVQRLIPTITSGGNILATDVSYLDQSVDFSTIGDVSLRSGESEGNGGGDGGDGGGGGDGGDGGDSGNGKDEGSSAEESSEGDSEASHEKRSTKVVRKFVAPSPAGFKSAVPTKSAAQQKTPSKKGKSVVIALVKPPSSKPKMSVSDDLKPSASEAVVVRKSVSGKDAVGIPVLTSEDVKEILEKSEPKESR